MRFHLLAASIAAAVAQAAENRTGSAIPTVDGFRFKLDGVTRYWAGTNAYWLPYLQSDADVDLVLDHMKDAELRIVRIWGFNDVDTIPKNGSVWFQAFQNGSAPEINTGADGLQRLDYVVRAAEKRGIKLIVPLVNNWLDFGGMDAYKHFCQKDPDSKSEWYTSAKCQGQYQKYIKAVVSRHVDSTAIFAWELANEPRCAGCDTAVITEWARKTSKYIKSLAPKHMVAVGDEGFGLVAPESNPDADSYPNTFMEGTDFAALVALPDIDFGTFHLYPDHWSISLAWGDDWIQRHAAACVAAKKPCLFEEFGIMAEEKCSQVTGWQKVSLKTKGVAGDMYWQYGDVISTGQTTDDRFTVFRSSLNWKCMVDDHKANIKRL